MQYLVINGDHNLKIDKHLKKVLPSARSSDNTITNLSKSNLNFTVEKKMSELLISSSSEFLIKNESDMITLSFFLQQERKSMNKDNFLKHKREYEAHLTTPYKKNYVNFL